MAISFEGANKPVTWGELVNYLAEMHCSSEVAAAKQSGDVYAVAQALTQVGQCPGKQRR